jgi:hypothetical protein
MCKSNYDIIEQNELARVDFLTKKFERADQDKTNLNHDNDDGEIKFEEDTAENGIKEDDFDEDQNPLEALETYKVILSF